MNKYYKNIDNYSVAIQLLNPDEKGYSNVIDLDDFKKEGLEGSGNGSTFYRDDGKLGLEFRVLRWGSNHLSGNVINGRHLSTLPDNNPIKEKYKYSISRKVLAISLDGYR